MQHKSDVINELEGELEQQDYQLADFHKIIQEKEEELVQNKQTWDEFVAKKESRE